MPQKRYVCTCNVPLILMSKFSESAKGRPIPNFSDTDRCNVSQKSVINCSLITMVLTASQNIVLKFGYCNNYLKIAANKSGLI